MADVNTTGDIGAVPKAWTPEEWAQIESNAMDGDVFATRIFEQLEAAPPLITREQIDEIEEGISKDAFRRAALIFSTSSGADLCRKVEGDREFAIAVAAVHKELGNVKARYLQLADLIGTVDGRLMLALCGREDMEAVVKAAS
ncbi:hypothetical protein [Paraburkholderia caffeinilytica]|uniref:hypothetical protein n=1 Tax=Paraburkholderia caffeinilytica TaxID=1761016 RepID=UPI003DA10F93